MPERERDDPLKEKERKTKEKKSTVFWFLTGAPVVCSNFECSIQDRFSVGLYVPLSQVPQTKPELLHIDFRITFRESTGGSRIRADEGRELIPKNFSGLSFMFFRLRCTLRGMLSHQDQFVQISQRVSIVSVIDRRRRVAEKDT
ncbi:hypothetical protein AVEN_111642-1 [Araneus ventricosus]|uniref:Uncharacterized protein n=1 Tax=Araneus ventricosus TaxID=182803 RepID=A0A4Y2C4I7_ARAVE|nr:hypothetical protein AVEN_111642-1 [Araneus ventricosus]